MIQEKRNIKVDTYDFFGYLIPGFVLFLATAFVHFLLHRKDGLTFSIFEIIKDFDTIETVQTVFLAIGVVFTSYVLGHFAASISSLFFDKIVIGKILQYPYQHIIFSKSSKHDETGDFCRIAFSGIYIVALFSMVYPNVKFSITYAAQCFNVPYCLLLFVIYLLFVIFFICIGQTRAFGCIKVVKFLPPFIIFYYSFLLIEYVTKLFIGYNRAFPEDIKELTLNKYKNIFGVELTEELGSEVFWSMYWHVSSKDPYIRSKIDKWMVLYSFMRNLACSCLISSILVIVPEFYFSDSSKWITFHAVVLLAFSVVFALRYYYLFYGYYSKNTFRAFAYSSSDTNLSTDMKNNQTRIHLRRKSRLAGRRKIL